MRARTWRVIACTWAIGCAACAAPPAPPRTPVLTWRELGAWTGRGPRQTESFTGETGSLRARWSTTGPAPGKTGHFSVVIHSAISGRPLQTLVEQDGAGQGEAFMSEDPRIFFAVVDSADIDWTLAVDEGVMR